MSRCRAAFESAAQRRLAVNATGQHEPFPQPPASGAIGCSHEFGRLEGNGNDSSFFASDSASKCGSQSTAMENLLIQPLAISRALFPGDNRRNAGHSNRRGDQ